MEKRVFFKDFYLFFELRKTHTVLKLIWKHKRPQRANAILTIRDFKLYCRALATKKGM